MEKEKRLVKNTIIVGAGKLSTLVISFCLLPLYTSRLNPEEYGKVDLYQTYTSIIIVFCFFQLEQALFRFLIDSRNEESGASDRIISNVIFYSAIIDTVLIIIGMFFIISGQYFDFSYICFMAAAMHYMEDMLQLARGQGDNIAYTLANAINSILLIILNIIFIVGLNMKSSGMIFSIILSNFISGTYLFLNKRVYLKFRLKHVNVNFIRKLLHYSLPLIPTALSWWIIGASDRLIVSQMIGVSAIGLITVSQKFSTALFNCYSIFNITWNEYVSTNIEDRDNARFSEVIFLAFGSFETICLGCIALIPLIFNSLINAQYNEAYYYIPIYILGTLFNIFLSLLNAFYVGLKKTKELAKTSVFSALLNIVISVLFIDVIGIYAAALSTLISFGVTVIWRVLDLRKYIDIRWNKSFIPVSLTLTVLTLILYYSRATIALIFTNIIMILFFWFVYFRKYILYISTMIKKKVRK